MDLEDDFTSYSDLLRSPAGSSVKNSPLKRHVNSEVASKIGGGGIGRIGEGNEINEVSRRGSPDTATDQSEPKQQNEPKDVNESDVREPEEAEPEIDIIEKQTLKVQLLQKKDQLLSLREELASQVETKKRQARKLQETKRKLVQEKTLEALLQQNNNEFAPEVLQKRDLIAGEVDDSWALETNLSVQPSQDWELRLQYIGRFFKHIRIKNVTVKTAHEYDEFHRIYEFCIYSPNLFNSDISVTVDANELYVKRYNFAGVDDFEMFSEFELPRSVLQYLCDEAERPHDITDLFHTLNSLAGLIKDRALVMYRISVLCKKYLSPEDKEIIEELQTTNANEDTIVNRLRFCDDKQIRIPDREGTKTYELAVSWEISLSSPEAVSRLRVFAGEASNVHDVTDVYLSLVETSGLEGGMKILFHSLFDYTMI